MWEELEKDKDNACVMTNQTQLPLERLEQKDSISQTVNQMKLCLFSGRI